ncbi:unnamed protein product [Ascophyllum nodosum]
MSPVGAIFVPFPPPKTGTNMLHPLPPQSLNLSAPSPAPAPAPAPGLATPAVTLPRVSSAMEQKRLARLAAAEHGGSSHGAHERGVQPVTHHVALRQELNNYRGQNVEADVCGFSLPGFGSARASRRLLRARASLWRHRICPI